MECTGNQKEAKVGNVHVYPSKPQIVNDLYLTAISESRKSAWDNFTSRQHEVLQIFTYKSDYSEILLIGKLTAVLKNNNTVVTEFIAQIQFEGEMQKQPQGTLYKVWGVSGCWNI